MEVYFLWGSIGILTLFLLVGMLGGLVRGIKRSSLHLLVFVLAVILAFFITKPITSAILNISITVNGEVYTLSSYIIELINSQFDLSAYESATELIKNLPNAIASPILFVVLTFVCFWVFHFIYLIVARLVFGKKSEDFKTHKPHRWLGGLVGVCEGFLLLFVMFAPLSSLTKTYQEIVSESPQTQISAQAENSNKLQTIPELLGNIIPSQANEIVTAYNNSILGKICGAGGLDNAIFDGLSNFKMDGEKIELRKEILNLSSTYNEFVVVYNDFLDNNFENINLTKLKDEIETFLNNGLFKKILAPTVKDFVVNFDETKMAVPELLKDVIAQIKTTFSNEDFDCYEYLKSDILDVLDIAKLILDGEFIADYKNLPEGQEVADILEIVGKNNAEVQMIVNNLAHLNLVKDCYDVVKNEVVNYLSGVSDMIDAEKIGENLENFKAEFATIGEALNVLSKGEIEVDVGGTLKKMSYVEYVFSDNFDVNELMNSMLADNTLTTLLDPVFESNTMAPLVEKVFDEIDTKIGEYTKVSLKTDLTNLKTTKTQTISAVEELLDITLNSDMATIKLADVGKILDILKTNAKSATNASGNYDGVFNEIFANLIWYVTGTDLTGEYATVKAQPHENANDILAHFKNYFDVEVKANFYDANYTEIMADLDNMLTLANSLIDKIPEELNFGEGGNTSEFVDGIKTSIGEFEKQEVVDIVENLNTIVDSDKKYDFISQEQIDANKDTIANAVEEAVNGAFTATTEEEIAENEKIIEAIKELLGLTNASVGAE